MTTKALSAYIKEAENIYSIKASDLLIAAKETISTPAQWCKWLTALRIIDPPNPNLVGRIEGCHPADPKAYQWCASGALQKQLTEGNLVSCSRAEFLAYGRATDYLKMCLPRWFIDEQKASNEDIWLSDFNDHELVTHADMIVLFNHAIRLAWSKND